jgi:hypothetical protein
MKEKGPSCVYSSLVEKIGTDLQQIMNVRRKYSTVGPVDNRDVNVLFEYL